MANLTSLIATDRSGWYARVSSAHPYVHESDIPAGQEYVVDEEKKEITFPGEKSSFKMKDVLVREYPSPHEGFYCLDYIKPGDFIQQSIAFLKKKGNQSHGQP